jgi:hypothetical protein
MVTSTLVTGETALPVLAECVVAGLATHTGSVPAWLNVAESGFDAPGFPRLSGACVVLRRAMPLPPVGQPCWAGARYFWGGTPAGSCTVRWPWPPCSGWPVTPLAAGSRNGDHTGLGFVPAVAAGATSASRDVPRTSAAMTAVLRNHRSFILGLIRLAVSSGPARIRVSSENLAALVFRWYLIGA